MIKTKHKVLFSLCLVWACLIFVLPVFAESETLSTDITGLKVTYEGKEPNYSTEILTVSATGTNGSCGSDSTTTITTTTLKNVGYGKAVLTFAYTATLPDDDNDASVKINGKSVTDSGSFSQELQQDEYVTIEVTSGKGSGKTSSITLTGITLTEIKEVTVTFKPVSGYAYSVNGQTVSDSDVPLTVVAGQDSIAYTDRTLPANTHLDYLLAVNENNEQKKIALNESNSIVPTESCTITPVYVTVESGQSAPFLIKNTSRYCWTLDGAVAAAQTLNNVIVLARDYTLPAGDYTIPAGVTLLIPFDAANTCCTSDGPSAVGTSDGWSKPTAYRTLTLASGANITVNGAISVSSKVVAAVAYGSCGTAPHSSCGMIKMDNGSAITVDSGGNLYAWGFITGDGTVTAESGATVYECFQFSDFRGGTVTLKMAIGNKSKRVFPFSQYYVQNIESTLYVKEGASVKTAMSVYMSESYYLETVNFIGSSGCFINITGDEAYITKRYDGSKDRLELAAYGDVEISNVKVSISGQSIDSTEFVFPLNSNITMHVKSGTTTVKQDLALLPGSQLIIDEGATVTIADGMSCYVYDQEQWGTYCFNDGNNHKFLPVKYAPGRTYTRTEADLVDAKIDVNGTLITPEITSKTVLISTTYYGGFYTTESGASIISSKGTGSIEVKGIGNDTITYQATQSGSTVSYAEIAINPAWLKNADGSYVKPTVAGEFTYDSTAGKWCCKTHTDEDGNCICDVCGKSLIKLSGATLLFEDEVQINIAATFDMYTSESLADAGLEVFYESAYNNGSFSAPTYTVLGMTKNGSYYTALTNGIAAKDMADVLYIRAYLTVKGTKYYTDFVQYSPKIYCQRMLKKAETSENQRALCIALMNYGAAAQKYFSDSEEYNYNCTTLMNEFLTDEQKGDSYSNDKLVKIEDAPQYSFAANNTNDFKLKGASIIMTGALKIRISAIVPENATEVTLLYWTKNDISDSSLNIKNAKTVNMTINGQYYQGDIEGIAAKNMGDTVYFCVKATVNSEDSYTSVKAYSIHKYAENKLSSTDSNMVALAKALVVYSDAAKTYFSAQ